MRIELLRYWQRKRTIEKQLTGFRVRSYTLQESESIADTVGRMGGKIRGG